VQQRILERIGVNLGDVIVEGEDRHGDGVNVAARLQQVAEPGGICVSRTVAETVKHKLSLQFELLGEHRVKNIAEPVSMYRVVVDGKAARPKPLRWPIRRFGRWSYAAATAFVLTIIAGAIAWNGYWREPACALASEKPSIAVLPFDYVGEEPQRLRIADGLSEDVIGNLSRLDELFVIAGNSTRIYKGGGIDVAEVGCDLGVTFVLQGSLQDSGARILVKPQLVEATNNRLVWSETFDRTPDDVLGVQDELTASIAARLLGYERDLPEEKRNKLQHKPPTDNLEAYDYYLQAETLGRGWGTTQDEALALYQKAIALDPKFADAYAGYARIVTDAWLYQIETVRPIPVARKEAYDPVRQMAIKIDCAVILATERLDLMQNDGYAVEKGKWNTVH
jgi:TolB-like protein